MALGTPDRRTHPNLHRRVDAIDDCHVSELFVIRATFAICKCVSVKRRRHKLFFRRILPQVTG